MVDMPLKAYFGDQIISVPCICMIRSIVKTESSMRLASNICIPCRQVDPEINLSTCWETHWSIGSIGRSRRTYAERSVSGSRRSRKISIKGKVTRRIDCSSELSSSNFVELPIVEVNKITRKLKLRRNRNCESSEKQRSDKAGTYFFDHGRFYFRIKKRSKQL